MNSLHADLARATIDVRRAEATGRHLATRVRPPRRRVRHWWARGRPVRRRAAVVERALVVPTPLPRRASAAWRTPPTPEAVLDSMLGLVAARIVEHGTPSEARVLTAMADAARREHPGAAAALVDWDGSEVARLRAFGVLQGVVLGALGPHARSSLLDDILGTDLPLAG